MTKVSQIIFVKGISRDKAKFKMYQRCGQKWKLIIATDAYIGKNGMTSNKKEGDAKTPRGVYELGIAFGTHSKIYSSRKYIQITNDYYWIDDKDSRYYNKMVNIQNVKKDWNSAEHLIDYKKQYEYAIEIKYNNKQVPGKGSAIFLHCSMNRPTAGCIAINREKMIEVLKKMSKNEIIVIY